MIFNRFNLSIAIQVILIALNTSLVVWIYPLEYMLITRYSLILLWFIQLIILINFVQKTNRELSRFLEAIKFDDTTVKFETQNKSPFKELYQSFDKVIETFGKLKAEKEGEHQFFQTAIQHMATGIIAFDETGSINLCNKAANQILSTPDFINIKSLNKIKPGINDYLRGLKSGVPELQKINIKNELKQISFHATIIKIEGKEIKLVAFQDIRNEIEQGEMDAWQKLIRVMTHEILNSVSPITLLSAGLINNFEKDEKQVPLSELEIEDIEQLLNGLKVIQSRSKGLSGFVEDYRSTMQLPAPHFKKLSVSEFFKTIKTLYSAEFEKRGIDFQCSSPDDLKLLADQKLIEQVLINLVNNAIHFTKNAKNPSIKMFAESIDQKVLIRVSDNGQGIEPGILGDIFIPFFSTKEKGTGIGLSLSRQIMRMHKGSISVNSKPEQGSTFKLTF